MDVHYRANPFQSTYHLPNNCNGLRVIDAAAEKCYLDEGEERSDHVEADPSVVVYPLVWTCPLTGRSALMAHPRCMHHLAERCDTGVRHFGVIESRFLLEEWMRPGIDPDHLYVHAWRPGDLVVWDNRSLWHSATGSLVGEARRIQHLTAYNGDAPPC